MGIQINGQTDTVTAIDGSLNVGGDVTIPGVLTGNADTASNLTGSPSITVTNITASGNVSIAGTLTYEDVTNIDSVGVVTARSGIRVTDGSIGIGTDVTPTTKLQIGADTADLNNVIKFGKRTPTAQGNLPLIGHYSHNGVASGLGLCATSSSGAIHFFTGNNESGFDVGINSERMRIHHDGVIQTFNHAECLARKNNQSVTGGDATTHPLGVDTFIFNRGGYTITSENIVVPKTGMYRCIIRWEGHISSSAYSIRAMRCRPRVNDSISGTYADHWHSVAPGPSNNTHWSFSDMYYLNMNANDQVDAQMQWYPYASRTEDINLAISLFYIG